jgi:hypothetical protein
MTVKEYIKNLENFIKKNPEILDMKVITSVDDEGNAFNLVHYSPSKGIYENNTFISIDECKKLGKKNSEINAVCVN